MRLREETISESEGSPIVLTGEQARSLNRLGRELASRSTWWGATQVEGEEGRPAQVIRCTPIDDERWNVRVSDAVGVISVDDLQIVVEPKIPTAHLIYLLEASTQVPRLGDTPARLARAQSFWELVARWYVTAVEALLRSDLIRDYRPAHDKLAVVRGRINARRTVRDFLSGQALISCEFEEFDQDNPLNRVLLAAARTVAGSSLLTADVRRRAVRLVSRMDDVGELQLGDLRAVVDRRTAHYREPIALAVHVLVGHGRTIAHGSTVARSFLFRTPELVEEGIRNTLAAGLKGRWPVVKRGLQLGASSLTLTPDLVFADGNAIGDVKYKLSQSDWNRSDFNQAITFATGFRAAFACVIAFARPGAGAPRAVSVGNVALTHLAWSADGSKTPSRAADDLIHDVGNWLSSSVGGAPEPESLLGSRS